MASNSALAISSACAFNAFFSSFFFFLSSILALISSSSACSSSLRPPNQDFALRIFCLIPSDID